jgi:hypothetical protein
MQGYFAAVLPDGETGIDIQGMRWTTTPPTEESQEGWYWLYVSDRGTNERYVSIELITIWDIDSKEIEFSDITFKDVTHWLGPLPQPEPPK